jgi:hypothetical protein
MRRRVRRNHTPAFKNRQTLVELELGRIVMRVDHEINLSALAPCHYTQFIEAKVSTTLRLLTLIGSCSRPCA